MNRAFADAIRVIPDFPKKGIHFRDITPLISDPEMFHLCIEEWAQRYEQREIEAILGLEARGFIFGTVLAYRLKLPFIPVRKGGKLPGETLQETYEKEYGPDSIEIQKGALHPGQKVLILDDVLATGGTAQAAVSLAHQAGAEVQEVSCLLEVPELGGRECLSVPVHILLPERSDIHPSI